VVALRASMGTEHPVGPVARIGVDVDQFGAGTGVLVDSISQEHEVPVPGDRGARREPDESRESDEKGAPMGAAGNLGCEEQRAGGSARLRTRAMPSAVAEKHLEISLLGTSFSGASGDRLAVSEVLRGAPPSLVGYRLILAS